MWIGKIFVFVARFFTTFYLLDLCVLLLMECGQFFSKFIYTQVIRLLSTFNPYIFYWLLN